MPPPSGWYQQNMPDLGGRTLTDMIFLDSLVGFATTNNLSGHDTGYILMTSNSGENWIKIFNSGNRFNKIIFYDSVGYACGGSGSGTGYICKTTNRGINWFSLNHPGAAEYMGMSVLNKDTLWLIDYDWLVGGVYRTTNGGQNWSLIWNYPGENPTKIYMYNARIGFICNDVNHLYKTTDGGFNWTFMNGGGFGDIYFLDSLTGYKCEPVVKKTTDGGMSWENQVIPNTGAPNSFFEFSFINKDTIWGVGGRIPFGSMSYRGIIYKTTNGGINWGYQLPDTSISIIRYNYLSFINRLNGWAYYTGNRGVHTTTGGSDTTIYTSVNNNISISNQNYELFLNYPNPFNSITNVKFKMLNSGFAEIKVYDITGKMIRVLTSKKYEAGEHTVRFDAAGLPSGVYFYMLLIDEGREYRETRKLILIK